MATPRVDAELLLAHVLGIHRVALVLAAAPDTSRQARFDALIARRAAREPLQHLTGTAPFRHLEVAVGPGVFIPRPETELLVDAVLPALGTDAVAVDLCAGTGALALSLALESPAGWVVAVESDERALGWLRRNTAGTPVEAVVGDVTDPELLAGLRGRVAVVVCNPPYVPSASQVQPEVAADPAVAVFAGPDGLALMPHVIARAAELLQTGGVLAVEHDDTHGEAVPALLHGDGRWVDIVDHRDLNGRPRYATARRAGGHR